KFHDKPLALRATDPKLEDVPFTRAALAMCENIDWNVGRILEKLREWKLADDTVVLYFSDNGPNGWRWNGGMKGRKGTVDEDGELFDMTADPGQTRDVSGEKPEVAAKLRDAVRAYAAAVSPLVGPDDRPYPVGFATTTWLPARDGVGHGGVERSAKAPNCS